MSLSLFLGYILKSPLRNFHLGAKNRRNDAAWSSWFSLSLSPISLSFIPTFSLSPLCTWLADESWEHRSMPSIIQHSFTHKYTTQFTYLNSRDGKRLQEKGKDKEYRVLLLSSGASVPLPLTFPAYNVLGSIQNGVKLNQNCLVLAPAKIQGWGSE